ncbi:signal peptidase complex subunit 3 [Nematocida displodere]|uniref:Signal peptidase complex subunit 3 n=1 Tax=Nematocida displodere TaxID=1805483 RepID=A0A177EB64_9MICR|nr:signal peptidase complex subunit 3 [Nematocida displodere]
MNTFSKRASTAASLYMTYLTLVVGVVFVTSFFMNINVPSCSPVIYSVNKSNLVFSPNINLEPTINYNVKELYMYLVQRVESNGEVDEKTIWSTLVKKNGQTKLFSRVVGSTDDPKRPLLSSTFVLKGSYFPYIGLIKHRTFATFKGEMPQ